MTDKKAKHEVSFNPRVTAEAARAVVDILQKHGERRVSCLAVAGLLVWMQAELAGDTIENTIDLMRTFIDLLQLARDHGLSDPLERARKRS